MIKPGPKPLKGAFGLLVAGPSLGFGVLVAVIGLIVGLVAGLGVKALAGAALAFLFGCFLGIFTMVPAYLFIGAPIFAYRKLYGPVQSARRRLARRNFLAERKALPAAPQRKQLAGGPPDAGDKELEQ